MAEEKKEDTTTIRIKLTTKARLETAGNMGQTFDDRINQLLDIEKSLQKPEKKK